MPNFGRILRAAALFLAGALLLANEMNAINVTTARDAAGRWQLLRDGVPYAVRGVGGYRHIGEAAAAGATTLRTWHVENAARTVDDKSTLDRAHELGLTVVFGIWLKHERHGYSYADEAFLKRQRDAVRDAVRLNRDHPALLVWGLGNEMEHLKPGGDPLRLWRELEVLARIVHEEDPHHPVMTVLAGAGLAKIRAVREHCPSIDILGINAYGSAPTVTQALDEAGWERAFMLTEFGPRGPWEIVKAPWDAPVEPRTEEKIAFYVGAHRAALADPRQRCVGTFCFTWGQKQEATATWFGMFLETGEKTPMVDAMTREFTGRWPANRSPMIRSLKVPFALDRVAPGLEFTVSAETSDPEKGNLAYEWQVLEESKDRRSGGDKEMAPPAHPECIIKAEGATATIRMPHTPGAYRLFLYVRDGAGGGTSENIPFFVQ